jgi:hypothetical protein
MTRALSKSPANLSGSLGPFSTRTLLAMLEGNGTSGTLFVSKGPSASLVLLSRGKAQRHIDLGTPDTPFDVDTVGAQMSFWPHADNLTLPTLPLRMNTPQANGFWALPPLLETPLFSTTETDLRALIGRLEEEHFSGALTLTQPTLKGLLLFGQGRLCGALCAEHGEETRPRSGMVALRTLLHLGTGAEIARLDLPELVVTSLLGLLLNLRLSDEEARPEDFSGLELSHGTVRYYRAGVAYLSLVREQAGGGLQESTGLYHACLRPPHLKLPTEPSGWEQRRYGLTLRGRDALNPMTELAMRFRSEFGYTGQRLLEQLRDDAHLEEAAGRLNLELSELKTTVERLEADGFIRRQP